MTPDLPDCAPDKPGKVKQWLRDHELNIVATVFILMGIGIIALITISNDPARLPVYELEVDGHRCIGTHQAIDLYRSNPHASIVHCQDGSTIRNAVNVRYIRLIKPGNY